MGKFSKALQLHESIKRNGNTRNLRQTLKNEAPPEKFFPHPGPQLTSRANAGERVQFHCTGADT